MDYQILKESASDIKVKKEDSQKYDLGEKAKKKLLIVCLVCSIFLFVEFVGGLLANSIAIMTDAAHLLSDLAGFVISIFAIYISKFPSDKIYTYGYHRAEVLGAITSVLLIWMLTVMLMTESIERLFNTAHHIDGKIMLITSSLGLIFNLIMAYILHSSEVGGCNHNHGEEIGSLLVSNNIKTKPKHQEHIPHSSIINSPRSRSKVFKFTEMDEIESPREYSKKTKNNNVIQVKQIAEEISENTEDENNNKIKSKMSIKDFDDVRNKNIGKTLEEERKNDEHHDHSHCHHKNQNLHISKKLGFSEPKATHSPDHQHIEKQNKTHQIYKIPNVNIRAFSSRNLLEKPDFVTPRKSQRSQTIKRRHSRLLHNLENFILSTSHSGFTNKNQEDHQHNHSKKPHCHHKHIHFGHSHSINSRESKSDKENINIRAAMIHIIGDIIQSIGVIIAAIIVYFFPEFHLIDPLMTILFSVIVMFTTIPIIKQCINIIMQGTPVEFDLDEVKKAIFEVNGVESILCLHIYSLSIDKQILSVKILSNKYNNNLLAEIHQKLNEYNIFHINVEIQKSHEIYYGNCE